MRWVVWLDLASGGRSYLIVDEEPPDDPGLPGLLAWLRQHAVPGERRLGYANEASVLCVTWMPAKERRAQAAAAPQEAKVTKYRGAVGRCIDLLRAEGAKTGAGRVLATETVATRLGVQAATVRRWGRGTPGLDVTEEWVTWAGDRVPKAGEEDTADDHT